MVSFIDADSRFKYKVEVSQELRAKASQHLCSSGLRKGKDWVRQDMSIDWYAAVWSLDTYLLKSEGAMITFKLWVSTQKIETYD